MDAKRVLTVLKTAATHWHYTDSQNRDYYGCMECQKGNECSGTHKHKPDCELALLIAEAEQEVATGKPTIKGVIELLYGTRKGQTREEYLERSRKACEEWGPVVLYFAEEEYGNAAAKLAELGYVKSDGRDGHTQGEWYETATGGWKPGSEPPEDDRLVEITTLAYYSNGQWYSENDCRVPMMYEWRRRRTPPPFPGNPDLPPLPEQSEVKP